MTEAVAWMYESRDRPVIERFIQINRANMDHRFWTETPLYTDEAQRKGVDLRPMKQAPRDRSFVLVKVRDNAFDGTRSHHYSGRWFVACHEGITHSDFDIGWSLFPGFGGVGDIVLEGWLPLPPARTPIATSWQMEGDIEVLMMGEIAVGRLCHRGKPSWVLNISGLSCSWKAEKTMEQARAALLLAFNGWCQKAGLV